MIMLFFISSTQALSNDTQKPKVEHIVGTAEVRKFFKVIENLKKGDPNPRTEQGSLVSSRPKGYREPLNPQEPGGKWVSVWDWTLTFDVQRGYFYHDTQKLRAKRRFAVPGGAISINEEAYISTSPSWRLSGLTQAGLFTAACIGLYALKNKWK